MTSALSPILVTRLEKVATDNGFDRELPRVAAAAGAVEWLGFSSTQAPLRVWLSYFGDAVYLAAFSQLHVARALGEYGTPMVSPLPAGAAAGRTVTDIPALHRLVRRAFQLSKTLPDELLHTFEQETAALPRATEAERLVVQRVGQDIFRKGLIEYWEGRCAITGLAVVELLRGSHIKPWAACDTDAERLDVFNGLLLAPQLDAAFDKGFITVGDDGSVAVSPQLEVSARRVLGLDAEERVRAVAPGHRSYLAWHRAKLFRNARTP
jgi:putative restriction endonuclease